MINWFVILLAVIVVVSVAILLYLTLFDNDASPLGSLKHRRGDFINDETAVIVHSIKHTADSAKAYQLFAEYILTNHKLFLAFVSNIARSVHDAYFENNKEMLHIDAQKVVNMKLELKDQVMTQDQCLDSIDLSYYIETAAWINIANNTRFDINKGLKRAIDVSLIFDDLDIRDKKIPEGYDEVIDGMVTDICDICDSTRILIEAADTEGMRELRKKINLVMAKSYDITSRLYALIHDGRNNFDDDYLLILRYVMNIIQECYCIIYSLRRLILCDLCIILSRKH